MTRKKGGKGGRGDQLRTVVSVLRLVARPGGATLYEVATALGVSTRTVRRVVDDLAGQGLELRAGLDGTKRRWHLDPAHVVTWLWPAAEERRR